MYSYPIQRRDHRRIRTFISEQIALPALFCTFGVHQAEVAVQAMILAEASTNGDSYKVFSQWGANKAVAEAFQIACLLTGKAANLSEGTFAGKVRYQLPIRSRNRIKLKRQSKWVHYKGAVWCPQVETGAWVMRCNGAVMITGNSGGTYERQVTLTDGVWPTWAEDAAIRIDDVVHEVASRKSDTVLTLDVTMNPGADVAAGAEYSIFKSYYALPNDFISMVTPWAEALYAGAEAVGYDEMLTKQRYYSDTGDPRYYCIRGVEDLYGSAGLYLWPPTDEDQTLDFIYQRRMRPVRYWGIAAPDYQGTITVTAGSAAVTGSGTAFDAKMVGSILRIGANTNKPTGLAGEQGRTFAPYAEQRAIVGYTSATAVTLDDEVETARSGVGYVVVDPIDIDVALHRVLLAGTIRNLASARAFKDMSLIEAEYADALWAARAGDQRVKQTQIIGVSSRRITRFRDTCGDTVVDQ